MRRRVMVLHKSDDNEKRNTLAVGETFTFPWSGDAYTVQGNGSVVSAKPKEYSGKAERKRLKRERRLQNQCSP
jgi:hypothetical protein